MPISRSTRLERRACRRLIKTLEQTIVMLASQGKRVHIIWDVDHVLVSGRSDDAFALLGFDVKKYFTYEERLLTEPLEAGPWAAFAARCGELHVSQDIVTARSSYLALRVTFFLITRGLPMRWQLFVGHQPKTESYRIVLSSFKKDADMCVINIDDAAKHCQAFDAVAAELGMAERCMSILSPQMRDYDDAELRRELDLVMAERDTAPYVAPVRGHARDRMGRYVQVTPDPLGTLQRMFRDVSLTAHKESMVSQHRPELEALAKELMPGREPTVDNLYFLWDLVRQP